MRSWLAFKIPSAFGTQSCVVNCRLPNRKRATPLEAKWCVFAHRSGLGGAIARYARNDNRRQAKVRPIEQSPRLCEQRKLYRAKEAVRSWLARELMQRQSENCAHVEVAG
jgi:hypothetical protein